MIKKKFMILVLTTMLIFSLGCMANAAAPGYSYFRKQLSNASLVANALPAQQIAKATSATVIRGTYINASASTYATFKVLQYADLANGKFQVSPKVSVQNNVTTWLGFYNGYSTVANKNIYLEGESQSSLSGDLLNGYWYR